MLKNGLRFSKGGVGNMGEKLPAGGSWLASLIAQYFAIQYIFSYFKPVPWSVAQSSPWTSPIAVKNI